jgi:hypothetical protein
MGAKVHCRSVPSIESTVHRFVPSLDEPHGRVNLILSQGTASNPQSHAGPPLIYQPLCSPDVVRRVFVAFIVSAVLPFCCIHPADNEARLISNRVAARYGE